MKFFKPFIVIGIISCLAFNTVPQSGIESLHSSNLEELAAVCPGSGAKCFSILWGAITVYKGKDKGFIGPAGDEQ